MDEFSENFQRGMGVIFNPKIYVADFGPLYSFFWTFSEKKGNIISVNEGGRGLKSRFEFFICFCSLTAPKDEFSAPLIHPIGCLVNKEEKLGN